METGFKGGFYEKIRSRQRAPSLSAPVVKPVEQLPRWSRDVGRRHEEAKGVRVPPLRDCKSLIDDRNDESIGEIGFNERVVVGRW